MRTLSIAFKPLCYIPKQLNLELQLYDYMGQELLNSSEYLNHKKNILTVILIIIWGNYFEVSSRILILTVFTLNFDLTVFKEFWK